MPIRRGELASLETEMDSDQEHVGMTKDF